MMATICKHLQLKPEYSLLHPALFQHYLPNIGPAMAEEDLERQREEERVFQQTLWTKAGVTNTSSRKKREFEEENLP